MIVIDKLTKKYTNGVLSLDGVSLEVPHGQVLGLVGTNGAGKSTLLRILSGIMREDSGSVLIDSEPVFENVEVKKRLFFVSDEGWFPQGFTLNDMASLHASMRESFSKEKFLSLCSLMRLDPSRKTNTFSKGMRRQGEVILALASGTEYLFFDETFDGLDPIAREAARRMIAESVAEKNTTVILSSHNLSEIESLCDSIALLDRGRIIFKKNVNDALSFTRKYQAAFENDFDESVLSQHFSRIKKSGKLLSFISELGEAETEKRLVEAVGENRLLYLESVSLNLDEIFSSEVEKNGFTEGLSNE